MTPGLQKNCNISKEFANLQRNKFSFKILFRNISLPDLFCFLWLSCSLWNSLAICFCRSCRRLRVSQPRTCFCNVNTDIAICSFNLSQRRFANQPRTQAWTKTIFLICKIFIRLISIVGNLFSDNIMKPIIVNNSHSLLFNKKGILKFSNKSFIKLLCMLGPILS